MFARVSALAVLAATIIPAPSRSVPGFALSTTGAVSFRTTGPDARVGRIPLQNDASARVSVSLGARNARGSLLLSVAGDRLPPGGRYRIGREWAAEAGQDVRFHASLVAGSVERPLGWFEGEAGWVELRDLGGGEVEGEFEMRGRGFTATNPDDEEQWVTVRGSFRGTAEGILVSQH